MWIAQLKYFSDEKETAEVDAVRSATERAMSKKKKNKPREQGLWKVATNMYRENAQLSERTAGIVEERLILPSAVKQKKKVQLLEKRSNSEDEEAPILMDSIEDGQTAPDDE